MSEREKIAIEIVDLCKSYGARKVLEKVSFKVNKGEIMGFLGPNGAGKSTTMNIITGYIASNSGKVFVDGICTADDLSVAGRKIGYLPEIPPLYTEMTVNEYLSFVYSLKGVKEKKSEHLERIMKTVGIEDVKDRLIKNLSKGYKQRVGFAQALIGDPEILILDEPTVGLDPRQIAEIREVISKVGKERTVILSTHIMQEVMAVCDSYMIINKGKIVANGRIDELSGNGLNRFRLRVKSDAHTALCIAEQIYSLENCAVDGCFEEGTVDLILSGRIGVDVRESIFLAFAQAGVSILSFELIAQTLEELFLRIISRDDNLFEEVSE